ncbi:MAG: hypothetical protein BWK80_55285 [Desulfobacteraceae bacterium IS3]|nr:MAG: hypothetical protein BWK80_55285 [Desulfobacteraceae bacterium IS3]
MIKDGTLVQFDNGVSLNVFGNLTVSGTSSYPVFFTSKNPSPGSWGGIKLETESYSTRYIEISYADISYADTGITININNNSTYSPWLNNSIIHHNKTGISINKYQDSEFSCITNSIIRDNTTGIYLKWDYYNIMYSSSIFNNCSLYDNLLNFMVDNFSSCWENIGTLNVVYNWWGKDNKTDISNTIKVSDIKPEYCAPGNIPSSVQVKFEPFLTSFPDFMADRTSGCPGDQIQFTDLYAGKSVKWEWDFDGDGNIDFTDSKKQINTFIYKNPGVYSVKLVIYDENSNRREILKKDYITVLPMDVDFSANPYSGEVPLAVTFTSKSVCVTSWKWDFNDDGITDSTVPDPNQYSSYLYNKEGVYSAKLIAQNETSEEQITKQQTITVYPSTAPDLVASNVQIPATASAGQKIEIGWTVTNSGKTKASDWYDLVYLSSDKSLKSPTSEVPIFSALDPGKSYTKKIEFILPTDINIGSYYIAVFTNGFRNVNEGLEENRKNNIAYSDIPIKIISPVLKADFYTNINSGYAPFTAKFTDQSAGNPQFWFWDFNNDGSIDSREQNPSYTYNQPGNYSVKLKVQNATATSENEELKTNYITVVSPTADFTADNTTGTATFTVNFTDKSSGSPISWQWDFGDGGTSKEQNPKHIYQIRGVFPVKLIASYNTGFTVEKVKTDYITVNAPVNYLPDLKVTDIQTSQAVAGQTIEVKWTVTNAGKGATNSVWYDRVWISPNIDVRIFGGSEDKLLGTFENQTYLDAGESYTQTKQFVLPANFKDTYYLLVLTDIPDAYDVDLITMEALSHGGSLVLETNEWNNFNFKEIKINPPPASNLTVIPPILIAPSDPFSGQSVRISWTVKNDSTNITDADSWWDALYISKDSTLTSTATPLGRYNHTGRLEPGATYTAQADVAIPQKFDGDYYIYVVTDIDDNVYEGLEEKDNTTPQLIKIIMTPTPDFVVTNVIAPETAGSGQTINVQWTVENKGYGKPFESVWNDRIYLYAGSPLNPDTAIVLGTFSQSVIQQDNTYSKSENVKIPDGLDGTFYLYVKTDCDNQVFENKSEDNNVPATPKQIVVKLSQWADLQVTPAQKTVSITAGQKLDITYTVVNNGEGIATGAWTDHIYISTESAWSGTGISLKTVSHTGPLASKQSYNQTITVFIPNELKGQYYVYVVTDEDKKVYENTGENNNVSQISTLTVLPYPPVDLVVSQPVVAPTSVSSGQPVKVQWTVTNNGQAETLTSDWYDAIYLSSDNQLDPSQDPIAEKSRSQRRTCFTAILFRNNRCNFAQWH